MTGLEAVEKALWEIWGDRDQFERIRDLYRAAVREAETAAFERAAQAIAAEIPREPIRGRDGLRRAAAVVRSLSQLPQEDANG